MTASELPSAARVARDYYDSDDADAFYSQVWGGEDIHIGLYRGPDDTIFEAGQRTIEKMCSLLGSPSSTTRVLDIGSGYGGAARYLVRKYQCPVVALNVSSVENQRARELNEAAGVGEQIRIVESSFEAIPEPDASFDVVWSQDAILHAGDRARVFSEVARVLRDGGRFVFTDPMRSDSCPREVLGPILARLHLRDLGSPDSYRALAEPCGFVVEDYLPLTSHLVSHYTRVLASTRARLDELSQKIAGDYLERMQAGLEHWISAGEQGHLDWGIFCLRREPRGSG